MDRPWPAGGIRRSGVGEALALAPPLQAADDAEGIAEVGGGGGGHRRSQSDTNHRRSRSRRSRRSRSHGRFSQSRSRSCRGRTKRSRRRSGGGASRGASSRCDRRRRGGWHSHDSSPEGRVGRSGRRRYRDTGGSAGGSSRRRRRGSDSGRRDRDWGGCDGDGDDNKRRRRRYDDSDNREDVTSPGSDGDDRRQRDRDRDRYRRRSRSVTRNHRSNNRLDRGRRRREDRGRDRSRRDRDRDRDFRGTRCRRRRDDGLSSESSDSYASSSGVVSRRSSDRGRDRRRGDREYRGQDREGRDRDRDERGRDRDHRDHREHHHHRGPHGQIVSDYTGSSERSDQGGRGGRDDENDEQVRRASGAGTTGTTETSERTDRTGDKDRDRDRDRRRRKRRRTSRSKDGNRRRSYVPSSSADKDDSVGHFTGGPGTHVTRRYKIIRDVGMGTFGRVVECSDEQATVGGRGPHVAIKIVRNVKRYHESALIEADIVEDVNKRGGRGRSLCAIMHDRFEIPDSGHYCLVFECLGRSLYDFLKCHDYRPFPLYCVRDFARQLLDALDFLHSFGLIHTDLKPENILLTSNDEVPYRNWDGTTQQVPALTKIKVIDFGGATYDREKKSSVINTRQYRAPEVILGLGWSTPSDLWSAGCIIAELYMGELLFATHDNTEHLALIERAVGPFPRDMLARATMNEDAFDSYGWHYGSSVLSSKSWAHVRKMGRLESLVTDHDRPSGLVALLRSLLTIDSRMRATAGEALKSPFFCSHVG